MPDTRVQGEETGSGSSGGRDSMELVVFSILISVVLISAVLMNAFYYEGKIKKAEPVIPVHTSDVVLADRVSNLEVKVDRIYKLIEMN